MNRLFQLIQALIINSAQGRLLYLYACSRFASQAAAVLRALRLAPRHPLLVPVAVCQS